jgi:NAD(P)H-nitrite reductase large subunit
MTSKTERPSTREPEHDEDRRATLGRMIATAAGAFVVSSGIAGAEQRNRPRSKRMDAKTTEMIPRQFHAKLTVRARRLTRKDLQAIAAGSYTEAQRERLKDVTFGDLKSVFAAVAASPRISDSTLVVPAEGVATTFPEPCCCTCCQ